MTDAELTEIEKEVRRLLATPEPIDPAAADWLAQKVIQLIAFISNRAIFCPHGLSIFQCRSCGDESL